MKEDEILNKPFSDSETVTKKETTMNIGGWFDVPREQFATLNGVDLYPINWRFQARSINVEELRHFCSVGSTPAEILDSMNYIITKCFRILDGKHVMNGTNIYEHDRFKAVLFVRNYSNLPNRFTFKDTCQHCKQDFDVVVEPQTLVYSEISDEVMRYYNKETHYFEFDHNKFGKIVYKPISIEEMNNFTSFARSEKSDDVDLSFMSILPLMVGTYPNKSMKVLYDIYTDPNTFTRERLGYFQALIDEVSVGATTDVEVECPHCNKGGQRFQINFERNFKHIFNSTTSALGELGR